MVQISIIIPASFEPDAAIQLAAEIDRLTSPVSIKEVIVVTNENNRLKYKDQTSKKVAIVSSAPKRSVAMNVGAESATGTILYFLHADSHPPKHFDKAIISSYNSGSKAGCFRLKFDDSNPMLRLFAYATRLPWYWAHFGDQSLYIDKESFRQLSGFDENLRTMEDIDLVRRIKRHTKFRVINKEIVTSARKYRANGYYKVQMIFIIAVSMHLLGFRQKQILRLLSTIKK